MSGMTGMELRFESGSDSEGRLPSSTKSCTFIWARRERERGDFCEDRLELSVTQIGFSRGICKKGIIFFQGRYAFLVSP